VEGKGEKEKKKKKEEGGRGIHHSCPCSVCGVVNVQSYMELTLITDLRKIYFNYLFT
jgi:hypothetical protein